MPNPGLTPEEREKHRQHWQRKRADAKGQLRRLEGRMEDLERSQQSWRSVAREAEEVLALLEGRA